MNSQDNEISLLTEEELSAVAGGRTNAEDPFVQLVLRVANAAARGDGVAVGYSPCD